MFVVPAKREHFTWPEAEHQEHADDEPVTVAQVEQDLGNLFRREVLRRPALSGLALFAYVDTLAKALLTCVPEPPADTRPRAVACAKDRYERLIKSAGRAMVGESKLAMEDLIGDLDRP